MPLASGVRNASVAVQSVCRNQRHRTHNGGNEVRNFPPPVSSDFAPPADRSGDKSQAGTSPLPRLPSLPIALALMTFASKSTFVLGHRHLLGIEGLSAADITGLLDLSEEYVELNRQVDKKRTSLRGRTQVNLFFEASTRTQSSFEIAGKRLGADVMNMSVSSSSMRKGETLVDTAV